MFDLQLLGPFSATVDGRPLTRFGTVRGKALLIYLAVKNEREHQREALMNLLWPDMPLKSTQVSLRQTLYLLRKALQDARAAEPPFLATRQTIRLNPDFLLKVDVHSFLAALSQGTIASFQEAAGYYHGPFLSDFFLPDSELFESWAAERRAAFSRLALDNLDRLAAHFLAAADYAQAEAYARSALIHDDFHEPAHRLLIETLAKGGNNQAAIAHYESFRQQLLEELDVEPAAATNLLVDKIRQGELAHAAEDMLLDGVPVTIQGPLRPPRENLPAQTKPFIGREMEFSQLDQFFDDPQIRLVTILGPGGIGKTQLAIEWARKRARLVLDGQTQYPDGVHFVDLAPLERPEEVVPAMAEVFAFPLEGERGSPEEQMLDYLRHKTLLLILDNFEQLIDSAAFVKDILLAAPAVRILVTSRERLQLSSEQVYALHGLSCPGQLNGEEDLESFAAVQLFLRSAQRLKPDYRLLAPDREPVARICRNTAGMPLAIELAAAWIDLLPVNKLAAEIERHLDILETDMRDLPERHRSIRAAIDTSWRLLKPQEQRTFALLSIFRGGFTWPAAAAVLGDGSSEITLRRRLSRLQDKSLLAYDVQKERFFIHELLRQYGAEKLQLAGQEEEYASARERHALYYARLLRDYEAGLKGAQFDDVRKLIEIDLENALLSWNWLIVHDRRSYLASMMDTLGLFLEMEGYLAIGRRNFRSLASRWQGHLAEEFTDFEKSEVERDATEPAQKSTSIDMTPRRVLDEAVRDLHFLAKALAWQSAFELDQHEAELLLFQSLSLLDHNRLDGGLGNAEKAFVFYRLGMTFGDSQTARAVEYFQQALKIYQALDDWWGAGNCLLGSGYFHFIDLVKGRRYLLQAIKVFEEGGNTRGLVQALTLLIHAATLQGDVETVEQLFTRYMTLVTNLEQSLFYPETMQANVHHHYVRGQFALAASFLERVISYNRELGRDTGFDNIMLGFCYLHADQFDRGRALLRQTQRELEQLAIDNDWRLALDIHLLAMLAIAERQFQKAIGSLQKARAAFEANDDILGIAGAETFTAVALVGLGDNKSGRPLLASSLKVALDQRAINNLTEVLSGIALLLAHQGELTCAREIYELLWRVPTFRNSTFYQGIAGDEIRELTAALTDEDQQAIKQHVADRNIWQEAAALLVELQDAGWEDANQQPTQD